MNGLCLEYREVCIWLLANGSVGPTIQLLLGLFTEPNEQASQVLGFVRIAGADPWLGWALCWLSRSLLKD